MKIRFNSDVCPEGSFPGKLVHVGPPKTKMKKYCDEQVQLTFQARAEGKLYTVYRKCCADLSPGTELRTFITNWLGDGVGLYLDDESNLDLSALIGLEADLCITHYQGSKHTTPFSSVAGAYIPGTLVKRQGA
jgi:hypothetical protein